MAGVALIAHFAGDPTDLAPRFRAVAHQYATLGDASIPTTALLLRNKDGITVVLGWPEGASLQPFRDFLRSALGSSGCPIHASSTSAPMPPGGRRSQCRAEGGRDQRPHTRCAGLVPVQHPRRNPMRATRQWMAASVLICHALNPAG